MIVRDLGAGFAPDVGFVNGLVYVAWGTNADLQVHAFTPRGVPAGKLALDGFFDSFPRITGAVLVYKAIRKTPSGSVFPATAFRLDTGARWAFPPSADGNWPCVVVDPQTVAWQTTGAWTIWLGSLVATPDGVPPPVTRTALVGVGDGIESVGHGTVVYRKDIRLQDPAVGGYPSRAGDLTVGQYGYGMGMRLDGQAVRLIAGDERDSHPDPRCATDGAGNYAAVCWGSSVRLYLGTRDEILALPLTEPPSVPVPTFAFTHPVIVAPFKDPDGSSGATHEISVDKTGMTVPRPHFAAGDSLAGTKGELLGIFSEASADPTDAIVHAAQLKTRLLLLKDGPGVWAIPRSLRKWDIPMRELYLVQGETLEATVTRWRNEVQTALVQWPGDLGVAPMFYCQGLEPPNELWPVDAVLRGLAHLSDLVNLSARVKVIGPFSYKRANGVIAHVELQQALANLIAAAKAAGLAALTPVPADPTPPDPTPPDPPADFYYHPEEHIMPDTETGAIKGPGNKYGRVLQSDAGKGPFGWYPVLFDRDTPDDDCWFEASKPDSRYKLRHTKVDGILGADATEHSTDIPKQFYLKPADERGILESPVLVKDPPSALENRVLVVGYFTWPEKGVSGPAFTWEPRK